MTGISVHLDDTDARGALARLRANAQNLRPAMDELGAHFVFSTQQNFHRESSPDGVRWPPLSPRTANKRLGRVRRGSGHMLRVKNRLYASISHVATDASVEWGSNVAYAGVHQLGGVIDMAPRQGSVSLKRVRRKGGGIRSRFARTGSKGAVAKAVSIRGHQVIIPARPYLGISSADQARLTEILTLHEQRGIA